MQHATTAEITITEPEEWLSKPGRFAGEWQGAARGANICVIANLFEEVGGGVRLHRHPYAETFIIRKGRVTVTLGDRTLDAYEGQIIVVPAGQPHGFRNKGPGPLQMIDIHESGSFDTEWLE